MIYRYHSNEILGNSRFFYNHQKKTGHSFLLPKESGNQLQIKNKLLELFSDKCAYCETKKVSSDYPEKNILLYRPPIVTDHLDRDYKWLSWQWPNMLYVCPTCNQNRNERFEIKGKQAAKGTFNIGKLQQEEPLLLNPCFINPAHYYIYEHSTEGENKVFIKANPKLNEFEKECATYTVEILGLNRDFLLTARASAWNEFENSIIKNEDLAQNDLASIQNLSNLISACDFDKEFAGAKRYFLQQWLDEHEQETKGSEWQVVRDQLKFWREETAAPPEPFPLPSMNTATLKLDDASSYETETEPIIGGPPRIIDHSRLLPHEEDIKGKIIRKILDRHFDWCDSLLVEQEFGTGFSGADVYQVKPSTSQGEIFSKVVKIDTQATILQEWEAYHKVIKDKLYNCAKVENTDIREPIDGYQAIVYELAGGGDFTFHSLKKYLNETKIDNINEILKLFKELFRGFENIWDSSDSRPKTRFNYCFYDNLLPVNLAVLFHKYGSQENAKKLRPQDIGYEDRPFTHNDIIAISGFKVVDIDPDIEKQELTLNYPDSKIKDERFRFRISGVENISRFHIGSEINEGSPIVGKVVETRRSFLTKKANDATGLLLNEKSEFVTLPAGKYKNPITAHFEYFTKSHLVKFSPIHGDLNLENILVRFDEEQLHYREFKIIDFANARTDHVLHDFLRLETNIWLYITSSEFVIDEGWNWEKQAAKFFNSIDLSNNESEVFDKLKTYHILRLIRREAYKYLTDENWSEYFKGLTLYMLGALKFDNLDDISTKPTPKKVAFWVACFANHFVENGGFEPMSSDDSPEDDSPEAGKRESDSPNPKPNSSQAVDRNFLHDQIDKYFILREIKEMCFELNLIDFENLSGETRKEKVIELVKHCKNVGTIPKLLAYCEGKRPSHDWNNFQI